ncbi:MAG TPA: glycosyltransferase [Pseudohaliea sp.]|nr:glycosyltransferase [Pseudohaliea sp.]
MAEHGAPRISVIIPAYNRATTIRLSAESVLRQTVEDLELIVVDDASSDGTAEAAEAIGDPRLRVIRLKKNRGPSGARNAGMEAARGEWIAFQDSDDEWLPSKLERQFAAMKRLGPDAIGAYCGMAVVGTPEAGGAAAGPVTVSYEPHHRAPHRYAPLEGANMRHSLLHAGNLISTQTFIGRRAALRAAGGFDESLRMIEDWEYFIRVADQGPIAFEPQPLVVQRFSPNSLTRSLRNRVEALASVIERNKSHFDEMPQILAIHYFYIAGGMRQLGELAEARRWIARSFLQNPWSPRMWGGMVRLAVAMALSPLRRRRG